MKRKRCSPVIQVSLEVLGHPTWAYLHVSGETSGKELIGKQQSPHVEGWFEATGPTPEGCIMNTEQSSLGCNCQIISARLSYLFVSVVTCFYFALKNLQLHRVELTYFQGMSIHLW